jgi:hypothetical protein
VTCSIVALVVIFAPPIFEDLWYTSQLSPQLEPLPAPEVSPSDTVLPIEVGNLLLNASASFFGGTPHRGPESFGFRLAVNVSNIGDYDITDFHFVKATAFSWPLIPLFSFGMETLENATIGADSSEIFNHTETGKVPRGTISHPSDTLFLRVLVTFDVNIEAIITTPLSIVYFWIE